MFQGSRFNLFSRQQPKKFVVAPSNNLQEDGALKAFAQEVGAPVLSTHETSHKTPDKKYGRERCADVNGNTYVELLSSTSGTLFVEESPERVQQAATSFKEITFRDFPAIAQLKEKTPRFLEELTIETFAFQVTDSMLEERAGMKRGRSQNEVMGETARDSLASAGAMLPGTEPREAVHWAHRHGWSIGGKQDARNLDLGTAGSNYSTLLWFEAPLKDLLRTEGVRNVRAQGRVYWHPSNAIPIKIEYEFSWGNGRKLVGATYPLETRLPTTIEYSAASAFFRITRTPQRPEEEAIVLDDDDDYTTVSQPDFNSM